MNPGTTLEAEAMMLYKSALASGDTAALEAFISRALAAPTGAASRGALDRLLSAERARLVKLKTLGLTGDFEAKIRLTDGLIALTRGHAGRGA